MTYLIELEVRETDYKDFIEYFDSTFDEWEDEDKVADRVYELLRHEDYDELVNCPYIWVDER
jgi:hypothetical protein